MRRRPDQRAADAKVLSLAQKALQGYALIQKPLALATRVFRALFPSKALTKDDEG